MYTKRFETRVKLNTMERVKQFVDLTSKMDCEVSLLDSEHVIDAKSIMGIFSLNLTNPLKFIIEDVYKVSQDSMSELSNFMI